MTRDAVRRGPAHQAARGGGAAEGAPRHRAVARLEERRRHDPLLRAEHPPGPPLQSLQGEPVQGEEGLHDPLSCAISADFPRTRLPRLAVARGSLDFGWGAVRSFRSAAVDGGR